MNVIVKIVSGTSPGPYNVYYDQVDPANLVASGVSYVTLLAGATYTIPNTATSVIVVNTRAVCAGNSGIVQTQPVTPIPSPSLTCTLAGIAKLAFADCKFAGTAVQIVPPCIRPTALLTYTFNNQVSVNAGTTYTPFSASQVDACNAAYNPLNDAGYSPVYTGIVGQVSVLDVGQTVYEGQGISSCKTVQDGYYLTNTQTGEVVEIVGGVIQSITICPYVPPPPPPPPLSRLYWNVTETGGNDTQVIIKDLSSGGGRTIANITNTTTGDTGMRVGHVYEITLNWVSGLIVGSSNQIRMRVCNITTGAEMYYTSPPVSELNPQVVYTFTATSDSVRVSVIDGGLIPPIC